METSLIFPHFDVYSTFQQAFHISRQTYREFNHYVVVMVNCLWNSKMFQPGIGVQLDEELLLKSNVPQYWTRFSLVHHPAFVSYAVDFHQKVGDVSISVSKRYLGGFLLSADPRFLLSTLK